jgi:hypothetical protein
MLAERAHSAEDVVALFAGLGYELFDEETLRPVAGDAAQLVRTIPKGGSRNLVALPAAPPAEARGATSR